MRLADRGILRSRRVHRLSDQAFRVAGLTVVLVSLATVFAMLGDIVADGLPRLDWGFLTRYPSRKPERAGILAAWVGTLWLMALTTLIALPLGIAAAIYLEEYARKGRLTAFVEINIANLAGVPSIIYGLLGLGLFVRWMELGRGLLAGAMTLAFLVMPSIILSTREALRAVPYSIREAAYALGASRWQTIRQQVAPAAMPGILTGVILALSRAAGETAPLVAVGAVTFITFLPGEGFFEQWPMLNLECLRDPFSALPVQIFNWVSRPQQAFSVNAAAAIIVLLLMTFAMNGIAVWLRYHHRRQGRG